VPDAAADHLIAPVMATFVERYPDVEIEVSVSNKMIDVVAGGFDAGVRYGGTVPEDMVAQRLSADIRWIVIGSPAYLERFGVPAHPDDLQRHRCIRIRTGDDSLYRWEFERGQEALAVAAPGSLIVDDGRLSIAAARDGIGLAYVADSMARGELASGTVRTVLDDWAAVSDGFHIYYSSRRQAPAALRLFIDLVRELRPLGL
jgi:DNA-binding transcriptional LysR family regulator